MVQLWAIGLLIAVSLLFATPTLAQQEEELEVVIFGGACVILVTKGSITRSFPCTAQAAGPYVERVPEAQWRDACERAKGKIPDAEWERLCNRADRGVIKELPKSSLLGDTKLIDLPSGASSDYAPSVIENFRVSTSPNIVLQAPNPRGWLATEKGGSIVNPAFSSNLVYSGYGATVGIADTLSIGSFSRLDMETRISFGSTSAQASGGGLTFLDGIGVTSVGKTPGVFIGYPTDVDSYDFTSQRGFATVESLFGYKLTEFQPAPQWSAGLSAEIGLRAAILQQNEKTTIETTTPIYAPNTSSTIKYDTTLSASAFGVIAGLKFDASYALDSAPEPISGQLRVNKSLGIYGGYDLYNINVRDSVNAQGLGGALNHVSDNSFEVQRGVMVSRIEGEIGIGNGMWNAFIRGDVGMGGMPYIDYHRPDSDSGGAVLPEVTLKGAATYGLSAGVMVKF